MLLVSKSYQRVGLSILASSARKTPFFLLSPLQSSTHNFSDTTDATDSAIAQSTLPIDILQSEADDATTSTPKIKREAYPISAEPTSSPLLERLPIKQSKTILLPSNHPDYSPTLTFAQLQHIQSGAAPDIAIHDGNSMLLSDGEQLPVFSKYGIKNLSEDQIFEWIAKTEHLHREIYKEVMAPDPETIYKHQDAHLEEYPPDPDTFWLATQLPQTDIRSWNLLLEVQTWHSRKFLSSTNDGRVKRKQSFLQILETFQSITQKKVDPQIMNAIEDSMDDSHTRPNVASAIDAIDYIKHPFDDSVSTTNDSLSEDHAEFISTPEIQPQLVHLEPNLETYDAMLKATAVHHESGIAVEIMREMGSDGYNPTQKSYSYLVDSYAKSGQSKEAHNILSYLKATSSHDKVHLDIYNSVIYGYLKNRRPKDAIHVFDEMMQRDGEHPNIKTYNIMMEYYRQTRNVNGAMELMREMEDRGYLPNQKTYAKCMLAAAHGDVEDAAFRKMFELYDRMVVTKEIPPTAEVFSALIVGCGRIGDIESATKVLYLMDKMKVDRTPWVYHSYLTAIGNTLRKRRKGINIGASRNLRPEHLIRLAEAIVAAMKDDTFHTNPDGVPMCECVDIHIVNALLSVYTYCNAVNRAMLFYATIGDRFPNVTINKQTLTLLLDMCIQSRRYKEAQYLFQQIAEKGFKQTTHMFREMVKMSALNNDSKTCVQLLKQMQSNGMTIRDRDRAHLATVVGTEAEKFEARRRQWLENKTIRKDIEIRKMAKQPHKGQLRMRDWGKLKKVVASKAAGVKRKDSDRTVGKIFWNVDRTLGQLDDPW